MKGTRRRLTLNEIRLRDDYAIQFNTEPWIPEPIPYQPLRVPEMTDLEIFKMNQELNKHKGNKLAYIRFNDGIIKLVPKPSFKDDGYPPSKWDGQ